MRLGFFRSGQSGHARFQKLPMDHPANNDITEAWVSMRHLQRATVFMKTAGLPFEEVLQRAGMSSAQLADGDAMVPLQTLEAIIEAIHRLEGDTLLGLRMADDIQPGTLGALGYLLQACSTLADLLDVAVRFNGLMSNIGHTSVHHKPGLVEVRWDCLAGSPLLRRHASEYIISTFFTLTQMLAPGVPGPIAVRFKHPRPERPEHARAHFDHFGCPVHFDQPDTAIVAPAELMTWRLPHGDAVAKELLERHAQHLLRRRASTSLADDVRRLLNALILAGCPTREAVALQLGTSTRSLHRRLEQAGTSFGEQLDAVRLSLACEHLKALDTPTADIAERLGFSSPQSFMRWFKQLAGMTPMQYRVDPETTGQ
ncbi:MAG: AraC family transcriptional regulator [Rubrivivax sp.]|nr:MAG: AraC family transcriptional regulator [Rubrivivax sp.]